MTIPVACTCGKRFRAKPELAGKRVRCPSCQSPIQIPSAETAAPASPPIAVTCQCGQRFRAPAHLAGKRVKCSVCQQPISVPDPQAAPQAAPDPLDFGFAQPSSDPLQPPPDDPLASPTGFDWNEIPAAPAAPVPSSSSSLVGNTQASAASELLAKARAEEVEKSEENRAWSTGQILSGIGMMLGAVMWFVTGLVFGRVFCYPPILFVVGVIAVINGIAYKLYMRSQR
jgi:hypothetical protein